MMVEALTPRSVSLSSLLSIFLLSLLSCSVVHAADEDWNPSTIGFEGYPTTPAWSDEFTVADGAAAAVPDPTKWVGEEIAWPYNGELQYYTTNPQHTLMKDGSLTIVADQTSTGGRAYTSARWSTKGKMSFRQGFFAARMQLPKGQGIWPAFWMFGNGPIYSEIDFVELIGGDAAEKGGPGFGNDKSYASIIWYGKEENGPIFRPGPAASHTVAPAKFNDAFHVFWAEWSENEVWVGFDDEKQKLADISHANVFRTTSMYLILNLAIGGGWAGPPDSTTVFPQQLIVDWVRVWKKDNQPGPVGPVEPLPIFTSGTPSEDVFSSTGGEVSVDTSSTGNVEGQVSSTGASDETSDSSTGGDDSNNGSLSSSSAVTSNEGSSSSTAADSNGKMSSSTADDNGIDGSSTASTSAPTSEPNTLTGASTGDDTPIGLTSSSSGVATSSGSNVASSTASGNTNTAGTTASTNGRSSSTGSTVPSSTSSTSSPSTSTAGTSGTSSNTGLPTNSVPSSTGSFIITPDTGINDAQSNNHLPSMIVFVLCLFVALFALK